MQQGAAGSANSPPQPPPPILKDVHEPGARFPDPPGATWHKRANEDKVGPLKQALGRASSEGHAFVAACDRWVPVRGDSSKFELVKMYASYLDARAFLTNTLLHSTARFLYEVIPLGAPCKLHWDIEWVGGTCDDAGIRIRDLMSAMNKYITAELAINTRFVVLRGTRLAGGGGYKHSYHIICVDVVFESNTHGMKAFVEGFIRIPEYNSFLQVLDGDGTLQKCIVDTGVYNKNRCFRTELSCKLGEKTSTGLQRVRLDRDGTWNEVRNLAVEDYLDAFVTHHADSFDRESIIPDPDTTVASQPDGRAGKKRRCLGPPSGGGGGQQAEGQDGETMARLQELVDAKGGAGCVVVGPLSDSVGASGGGRGFQCRNNGERSCLVTPGAVHANNNCYLTVDSRGTVRYRCHARECKSVGPVEIGELGDVGSQAPVVDGIGGRVEDDAHTMDVDDATGIEAEGAKHTGNAEGAKGIHAERSKHTNAVSTRGINAERTKHTNAEGAKESGSQNESEPEGGGDAEGSDSESGSQHESVLQEGGGDAEGSDSESGSQHESEPEGGGDAEGGDGESGSQHELVHEGGGEDAEGSDSESGSQHESEPEGGGDAEGRDSSEPIKISRKRKIGAAGRGVKRRSRYVDDEASASDKDEQDSDGDDDEEDETCGGFVVDDDEATPSCSESSLSGDEKVVEDDASEDDAGKDDAAGGDGDGNCDDEGSGEGGGGSEDESSDSDTSDEGDDDDHDGDEEKGGDDMGDDEEEDGEDNTEVGGMRNAKVLTGVSFPCIHRSPGGYDLLIDEVGSLVTFLEDPDETECKVLIADASAFERNWRGRYAKGIRSQTIPIKVRHLEPPVDKGDERPLDFRLRLYIGGLHRSNMTEGKIIGVCQAIRDVCRHHGRLKGERLMKLFKTRQKLFRHVPPIVLSQETPSLGFGMAGAAYALPLLRHFYVEDNPSYRDCELTGYPVMKEFVERWYFKNEDPVFFFQFKKSDPTKFNVIDEHAMHVVHRNKHFCEHRLVKENKKKQSENDDGTPTYKIEHRLVKENKKKQSENDDGTPTYKIVKVPFVSRWLEDKNILTSMELCCDPTRPSGFIQAKGIPKYNTWSGFYAERLCPVPLCKEIEAMACFEDVIFTVTADQPFTTYMMDYFSNIIQHPESKTQVGILLQGPMGCGKSTIFDVWRAIVGDESSSQTGKPNEDYFSRFSTGLKNVVIAQIDEAHDLWDKNSNIKDLMVAHKRRFEDKGLKPYTLDNHVNIVCTTNDNTPLKFEKDDRRWTAIKCPNGDHVRSSAYWIPKRKYLFGKDTLRALYQGFKKRDITHITCWSECRPKTPYYEQCVRACAPLHTRFLSYVVHRMHSHGRGPGTIVVPASRLYEVFICWARAANYQHKNSLNLFSELMMEYTKHENCGFSWSRTNKQRQYQVNAALLEACLKQRGEFDEHAANVPTLMVDI